MEAANRLVDQIGVNLDFDLLPHAPTIPTAYRPNRARNGGVGGLLRDGS
jgi:hypothetical protein